MKCESVGMNTQGVDPLEYVSHLCAKLTGWVINVLTMFSDLARRDPGSGLWPKFAALAGSSCGSSRSEAGSHSKAATTSAPTCRPARRHPPHLYCTGGAAVHTSCSFLCCALGAGSCLVLMHTSFCLFCCCCCFAFLFKTFTGRNQGHQTPWWSHRIVFLTVTVKTPFFWHQKDGRFEKTPSQVTSLLTFNQLQTEQDKLQGVCQKGGFCVESVPCFF